MQFITKFVYDLTGIPEPSKVDLDNELDHLLCLAGIEQPSYLESIERDPLDSEVISLWLKRKLEPSIITLLLESQDNRVYAKNQLRQLDKYKASVDKFLRTIYACRQAKQRIRELCFDNDQPEIPVEQAVERLKRALSFLDTHMKEIGSDKYTLLDTEAYTQADITLYAYLKRLWLGNLKDDGLKSRIISSSTLTKFMDRYANCNKYVVKLIGLYNDPQVSRREEYSIVHEFTAPAIVTLGFVLLVLWRNNRL